MKKEIFKETSRSLKIVPLKNTTTMAAKESNFAKQATLNIDLKSNNTSVAAGHQHNNSFYSQASFRSNASKKPGLSSPRQLKDVKHCQP